MKKFIIFSLFLLVLPFVGCKKSNSDPVEKQSSGIDFLSGNYSYTGTRKIKWGHENDILEKVQGVFTIKKTGTNQFKISGDNIVETEGSILAYDKNTKSISATLQEASLIDEDNNLIYTYSGLSVIKGTLMFPFIVNGELRKNGELTRVLISYDLEAVKK
ncbi:MAG: hypothetical protein IJ151_01775 [Bacteroidales bacterium]|nr:hypothetical protein [Bacteroidales bacterium]